MSESITAFWELSQAVIKGIPLAVLGGTPASGIFWLFSALVLMQYRRIESNESRLYGAVKNKSLNQTLRSLGWGLVGGTVASILLVYIGIPLSDSGIAYLFPVALLLMFMSPRLMCFAYSGGIISMSYLLFGWPRVNVAAIMALVGILHLTESLLIRLSGAGCSTPLFVRNARNELVGGFGVQRFWPMPLIAVFLMSSLAGQPTEGWIATPEWWPLLGLRESALANTNFFYVLFPVAAGLGYGDIAVTCSPRQRAQKTSLVLCVYSAVLILLALAASRLRVFEWVVALFAPLGHEVVARRGSKAELTGDAKFVRPEEGVMVLDVLPGSEAEQAGIRSGDVVLEINGRRVSSRDEMRVAIEETPSLLEMVVREEGAPGRERLVKMGRVVDSLGVISVPEPGDETHVEFRTGGPLARLFQKVLAFLGIDIQDK